MTNAIANATSPQPEMVLTAPVRMSQRLWGLDWSRVLPWQLEDVVVESGTADEALRFVETHYAEIFGATGEQRFLADPLTDAKRRFCAEMDVVVFRHERRIVGILMAHPSDWSTYYMRTVAILPQYRERRLLTRFMDACYAPLRDAGIQRIEGECSPLNAPMMRMLVGQDFIVTSTSATDRWGTLVRFTKFLSQEAQQTFRRQLTSLPAGENSNRKQNERRTS